VAFIVVDGAALVALNALAAGPYAYAAGPPPTGVSVHLYANDYTPNHESVLADFTEITYTGYAAQLVTAWATAYINANDQAQIVGSPTMIFSPTGTLVSGIAYGYYALDKNGNLVGAEQFPTPITLASPADAVTLVPSLNLASAA